jgi:hypothetical protein
VRVPPLVGNHRLGFVYLMGVSPSHNYLFT